LARAAVYIEKILKGAKPADDQRAAWKVERKVGAGSIRLTGVLQ
jgi:hypothetical protein